MVSKTISDDDSDSLKVHIAAQFTEKVDGDHGCVLASCLAFLAEKSPDLAIVVGAWDKLSAPLRSGILAMIEAAIK